MTNPPESKSWIQQIDATLEEWRQGDFVLGEQWFVQRYRPDYALTQDSKQADPENGDLVEYPVNGLVVVTQTCDIVRPCERRPYIEVVPLVEVDEQNLLLIQKGHRPQYAFIPGAEQYKFVADLDRIMTVEKPVIASWERQIGCRTDQEIRDLGWALGRKRQRFAFPEDFVIFTKELTKRLKDKHDRNSEEGEALRALQEIRVRASPSWNAAEVELIFLFIRDEAQSQFKNKSWDEHLDVWLKFVPKSGRFSSIEGQVTTLEDLTAKEYKESEALDLDQLSLHRES